MQVEAAAEQLANTTVRVVSDGVSGVVSFGNDTWHALSADSPAADLAPATSPLTSSQVEPLQGLCTGLLALCAQAY